MDKIRVMGLLFVLLTFAVCGIQSIKAEELKPAYSGMQHVESSSSSESYMEGRNQEDTFNSRMKTENLILKWSFGITVVLLASSIPCLFILSRKYRSLRNHEECDSESATEAGTTEEQHYDIDTSGIQNEAINLFRTIDRTMREDKPYINIEFSRDTMIRMFNTNKNKLNEAIVAGSGMSCSKYIRELRLQESIRIIENDSNVLLNDLAVHCGFNTYSSFYRSFYKRFGMSPADYKCESKKKQKTSNK